MGKTVAACALLWKNRWDDGPQLVVCAGGTVVSSAERAEGQAASQCQWTRSVGIASRFASRFLKHLALRFALHCIF